MLASPDSTTWCISFWWKWFADQGLIRKRSISSRFRSNRRPISSNRRQSMPRSPSSRFWPRIVASGTGRVLSCYRFRAPRHGDDGLGVAEDMPRLIRRPWGRSARHSATRWPITRRIPIRTSRLSRKYLPVPPAVLKTIPPAIYQRCRRVAGHLLVGDDDRSEADQQACQRGDGFRSAIDRRGLIHGRCTSQASLDAIRTNAATGEYAQLFPDNRAGTPLAWMRRKCQSRNLRRQ